MALHDSERLGTLEREFGQLNANLERLLARQPGTHASYQSRPAKAVAGGSTYPTGGNTFYVEFQDGTFTKTPGTQSPTYQGRNATNLEVAHCLSGTVPTENSLIEVFWWSDRWWWDPGAPASTPPAPEGEVVHVKFDIPASGEDLDTILTWPHGAAPAAMSGKLVTLDTAQTFDERPVWTDGAAVWIVPCPTHPILDAVNYGWPYFRAGMVYVGRKIGTYTVSSDARTLVLVGEYGRNPKLIWGATHNADSIAGETEYVWGTASTTAATFDGGAAVTIDSSGRFKTDLWARYGRLVWEFTVERPTRTAGGGNFRLRFANSPTSNFGTDLFEESMGPENYYQRIKNVGSWPLQAVPEDEIWQVYFNYSGPSADVVTLVLRVGLELYY